jgi:hypothetical protein
MVIDVAFIRATSVTNRGEIMASQPVEILTNLSIKHAAMTFQQAMRVSKLSEWKGQGTEFTKPPRDEAFGDLEEDPPDFEVMAVLGGGGSDLQKSGVQMYAWDRGGQTEIVLVAGRALFALGVKAKTKMRKFVDALRAEDPSLQVSGLM